MPSDATAAIRSELVAAITRLYPHIRGLEDLSKVSLSEETLSLVRVEITDHTRRHDLCQAVLFAVAYICWARRPFRKIATYRHKEQEYSHG